MLNLFNFDLIVISTTDVFQKDSPHQCSSLSNKKFVKYHIMKRISQHHNLVNLPLANMRFADMFRPPLERGGPL